MERKDFIENLAILNLLLDQLAIKGKETLAENRKIRKLLKLPNTAHNKARLNNYLNSTKQSASNQENDMARTGSFLSGPTGVHNTQKIRKHRLNRGVTRDMNAAAGTLVNTKNPNGVEAFRYAASPKAIGPRFGKTANPKRATFRGGRTAHSKLLGKGRRRR